MDGARIEKARRRRCGRLASPLARLPAQPSVCRTLTIGGKADAGCSVHAWRQRQQERGYQPYAEAYEAARMVRQGESWGCSPRTDRVWAADPDAAGREARLQPVRLHALSAGLRPAKAGRDAGLLPDHGLHVQRCGPCQSSIGGQACGLEAGEKNANASPATGRCADQTSRHGTNGSHEKPEIMEFVPPRDKTPCFSGAQRPATGHLSRLAISTVQTEGRY